MDIKQRIIVWLAQYVAPCQVIAHRLSTELESKPGWRERLSTRMHLSICVWCRRYKHQLALIKSAAQLAASDQASDSPPLHRLPDESKDRIRRALRDAEQ
ncbi:MAG: hypothetical protein AB1752_05700 [Candidatus Zixiibacteriota bacterium]